MNGEPRTMSTHRKLMTGCCVAVLTFGLAACGGGGDDDGDGTPQAAATATGGGATGGAAPAAPVAPVLTELATAQKAAADAEAAAKTASESADAALARAVAAGENHATLQTTCCGVLEASEVTAKAKEHADAAMAAYELAKAAAAKAAAAELITVAVEARIAAEAARDVAVAAAAAASKAADDEEEATIGELKIVGTVKSVGETTLDAAAMNQQGDHRRQYGERPACSRARQPMAMDVAVVGSADGDAKAFMEARPAVDGTAAVIGVEHKQAVAARSIPIGKTVDSADDTARLMIVTSYAGTKSVKVYSKAYE